MFWVSTSPCLLSLERLWGVFVCSRSSCLDSGCWDFHKQEQVETSCVLLWELHRSPPRAEEVLSSQGTGCCLFNGARSKWRDETEQTVLVEDHTGMRYPKIAAVSVGFEEDEAKEAAEQPIYFAGA